MQFDGVKTTPPLKGLNAVLGAASGSVEEIEGSLIAAGTAVSQPLVDAIKSLGKGLNGVSIPLQDTPLSSVPELIPLLNILGIDAGNH